MSGLGSAYAGDMPAQEPEILRLMSRTQDANARLVKLADHIESVADRLYGPVPKAVQGSGANTPHPNGAVPMLALVIDALHNRITDLEDAFSRIGSL